MEEGVRRWKIGGLYGLARETRIVELESLMDEAQGGNWPAVAPKPAIKRVNYSHDAMVDLIIASPGISQNDLAAHFGYSASWVSQVIASDAFQARLAERTKDLVDPTLRATVEDRFRGMVLRSLEILSEKLNRPSSTIPDNLVIRSLELSSRALGYGARDQSPPVAPVEMHVHLEKLGGNLTALLTKRKAETFDQPSIPMETSDDKKVQAG